jgi:hypothetical protein
VYLVALVVESHLLAGNNLIVLGDFNDGLGLDEYEELFGRSGIKTGLGGVEGEPLFDLHACIVLSELIGAVPAMARFCVGSDR